MNAIRVVLADDTDEVRMMLRVSLRMDGRFVVVGEACNGAEAIVMAEAEQPDVVVLDLAMPVMDGLQAIPEIRKRCPRSKIAVFSGFETSLMASQAKAAGAHRYLEKGADVGELTTALAELCESA